ncbi:MAG: zinc ribbon domain-containing protein [Actinobacteria bacterium]|nr:zinc ribbon domain-containing protein [Actinomycetota bacterium]
MPIYEYRCGSCGHEEERIVGFSSAVEAVTCKCGAEARRLISVPGRVWAPTRTGQ